MQNQVATSLRFFSELHRHPKKTKKHYKIPANIEAAIKIVNSIAIKAEVWLVSNIKH